MRVVTSAEIGARITEIRLNAFKSYALATLELAPLTLLVGSNASGKSNALDALALLALLAEERSVNDLERGDEDVAGLRGGLTSAAPFGSSTVKVGCTVASGDARYLLDVEFDVQNEPEIASESLVLEELGQRPKTLYHARRTARGSGISDVEVYSGRAPKGFRFLSSRLSVVQAITKIPSDSVARTLVVEGCQLVVDALKGVFLLDPVPGQMRGYPRIGTPPNRHGSSTSAMLWELQKDAAAWEQINELVAGLVGSRLSDLDFVQASYPGETRAVDVMVALREKFRARERVVPASVMSDGTLRYLAITATLLSLGAQSASSPDLQPPRTLVIEEIENGLYPTQAAAVLELLRREARRTGVTLLVTTHSPALLDALSADDHRGVLICQRSDEGVSTLRRLTEHPNYISIAAGGRVGTAMAGGKFEERREPRRFSDLLEAEQ